MTPEPSTSPAPQSKPVTNRSLHLELLGFFRRQLGGNLIVAMITVGGATLGAWKAVASEARQQADAGVREGVVPVQLQVNDLGRRVERVEEDVGSMRREVHEVQADIRALYRFQRTGEPQLRLELPAVHFDAGHDGGAP